MSVATTIRLRHRQECHQSAAKTIRMRERLDAWQVLYGSRIYRQTVL
jgi:hypothetical protein